MIDFKRATSKDHFEVIAKLAHDIWHEHYTPIIGKDQVNYMVAKFQTSEAMQQQAEEGYEYYVLNHQNNDVGYLAIEKRDDDLFLSKIYLLKTCRGKGFGKVAFNFIEKRACDLNCKSISLTVNIKLCLKYFSCYQPKSRRSVLFWCHQRSLLVTNLTDKSSCLLLSKI